MDKIERKSYLFGLFKSETKPKTIKKNTETIIAKLAQEFTDRTRADINKWKEAMALASNPEDPRWFLLQDLYTNLLNDGHIEAVINIRLSALMANRFYIRNKKTGKEDSEKTSLLQKKWFLDLLSSIWEAKLLKVSVLELTDPVKMEFKLIPRRNVSPQNSRIYFEVGGNSYIDYSTADLNSHILYYTDKSDFGKLNTIIPQLIYKRNAQQTWADFSERFGIPLIFATTTRTAKPELDRIETMLRKLGQAAQAVLPEGTKIEVDNNAKTGDPYNVFLKQMETTNKEISKALLGGTMLIDDGASLSQSEVHERIFERLVYSDLNSLQFYANEKILPFLNLWGFGFTEIDEFVFDYTEDLTINQHWDIISNALQYFDIPVDWISQRFNFPIESIKNNDNLPLLKPKAFHENFR